MYGVVLWSDKKDQKAVIWCEDHGDLAFYSASRESVFDGLTLDTGDFIEFELAGDQDLRVVRAPQLIAQNQYLGLADNLKSKGLALAEKAAPATKAAGNVIDFVPRRGRALLAC
ncbi:hypothetical protein N4R57_07440 [Rhodobacteraceae bacterium D3-12]|nr:hypothetical protein N4R57_07440 [Rhodobacteraceae bacterium D3-12]